MKHKKALTQDTQKRYAKATKKEKTRILDEFINFTGYNRTYAARILRLSIGRIIGRATIEGRKVKYVIGKNKKTKRVRSKIYTHDVFLALRKIWTIFDFVCSKRLKPFMEEAIDIPTKHKEIDLSPIVKQKLLNISASTINRLLKSLKGQIQTG